jgi:23S rRNA maturation mini-RNase III
MDAYIGDAVYHPRIVAHLITLGFTLSKAAKGRTVTGAASH